jgi:transcriptional regulator with XRE-family HTH domain
MSPFSHLLYSLRMRLGIHQSELADLLGYKQAYISALEVGVKGPPTQAFVEKLIAALELSNVEGAEVRRIAEASQRKFVLDLGCHQDVYWLFKELHEQAGCLHPAQVKLIREILDLQGLLAPRLEEPPRRLKRRSREAVPV